MKILVVDDEPMLRLLMATALKENGFSVLTADGGAQALAIFKEHPGEIDLLISDIVMPGMDGPSLATELRRLCPNLKVLLISGYCNVSQLSHGFEFLPKPFSLSDMVARVRMMLRAGALRVAHASAHAGESEDSVLKALPTN